MATRAHLIRIHRLAAQFEPRIARAVERAIRRSRDQIDLEAVLVEVENIRTLRRTRRLRRSDFGRLHRAVLETPQLSEVVEDGGLAAVFTGGAQIGAAEIPKSAQLALRFDRVNEQSVRYVEQRAARMVREIDDETRRGVETIVRRGFVEGVAPIQQSRQIREIVGLTERQARAIGNFRAQLEGRVAGAADRRLSATEKAQVRRHVREGHLSEARIDALVERYRASLVNRRAQNIARTESLAAANGGQLAIWQNAQRQGLLPATARRQWVATGDSRTRPSHAAAHGQRVRFDEPFVVEGVELMMPPGGFVNCRCAAVLHLGV